MSEFLLLYKKQLFFLSNNLVSYSQTVQWMYGLHNSPVFFCCLPWIFLLKHRCTSLFRVSLTKEPSGKYKKTGKKTKEGRVNEFNSLKNTEGTQRTAGGMNRGGGNTNRLLLPSDFTASPPPPPPPLLLSLALLKTEAKKMVWLVWHFAKYVPVPN